MYNEQGDVIQWKRLWLLVSGINFETPTKIVQEQLSSVSKQLLEGLNQFKKNSTESDEKLKTLLKKLNQEKLLTFTQRLQQYLNLDSIQIWDILCHYLINEYKGSATSLANYISTESAMIKLLNDIWSYYSLERMILLKIVKILLEFQGNASDHPYAKEFESVLKTIDVKKLLESYIDQFDCSLTETLPGKLVPGDLFNNTSKLIALNERKVKEQIALLQIIILAVDHLNGVEVKQAKKLVELFRNHSFGRQKLYLNIENSYHCQLINELVYHEVAFVLKMLDLNENHEETYVKSLIESLNKTILSLHQFPEHGPLLFSWMLVNFQLEENRNDDEITTKLQQLGARAAQLKVFEWLLNLIKNKSFQDPESKFAIVVRKSIYNHLCALCDLCDETYVCQFDHIYELVSELLKTEEIAIDFCKRENSGLSALLDVALEYFPITFVQLSQMMASLSNVNESTNKRILKVLESMPVYSEEYLPNKYQFTTSPDQDTYVLLHDYQPFVGIPDFIIRKNTQIVMMDKLGQTVCQFRTNINYFTVLHNEIDRLLAEILHNTEIDPHRLNKVTIGLEFLASVIKRSKYPSDINEFMVHPTEMVFDLLMKFRSIQHPPMELMAVCLKVCTALIPLFDQEIITRVLNLNILPSIKQCGLDYKHYAIGAGFEPQLVGNYLVNIEKNVGRYVFLKEYLEFLTVYRKFNKDPNEIVEVPGLIFILREVFPNLHTWKFESDQERLEINTLILRHFFDTLQPSKHQVKKLLRQICIHTLLDLGNGMPLLRFVAVGNSQLQLIMENESNWMTAGESGVNYIIQLALTILMQILRYKSEVEDKNDASLSPIESLIYTQPKQMDHLRIISVVTSYMNNIFNQRLPILACRLLRRFALEFQMSLLACLDMEPDQIRLIFLQRLRDDLESHHLKVAILEFVESCIEKQPGLTEAFFKISYENEKRFLEQIKANKKKTAKTENDGILHYMQEFLDVIHKNPEKIASPLLSRIMALFHSLWKNNMQGLVSELMEKKDFWSGITSPLFADKIHPDIKAYSQLFNILGVEIFRITVGAKYDDGIRIVIERLLEKSVFTKWLNEIFNLPDETEAFLDIVPEWLCRLQSFKDLMILLLKCKPISNKIPQASRQLLASKTLKTLIKRTSNMNDTRPLVILSEFYLILLKYFQLKYTENEEDDKNLLESAQKLLEFLSGFYKHLLPRAKNSILAICIKLLDLLSPILNQERLISIGMLESTVEIVSLELFSLENEVRNKAPSQSQNMMSSELVLILLKNLISVIERQPYQNWNSIFISSKLYNQVLSCLNAICQNYEKRKITEGLLDLLVVFSSGDCSLELLFCDIGDYLWLKLLPPKELLQRNINSTNVTPKSSWEMQDWWPIYIKGIQLVTKLLETHNHHFTKEAVFFIGIHEEYLLDSLLLVKQCLEPKAVKLIKTTLGLLCEMCRYEQFWRLEHCQSLSNLMRCVQVLMDSSVSLLYRPKILKRLINGNGAGGSGSSELDELIETRDLAESTDEIVEVMNDLIEIITLSSRCLLWFSPTLLDLICEPEFLPSQYFALIEIQFGAPKLTQDNSLSFGTVLSAISIFVKSLNLQQYTFHEIPINKLPGEEADTDEIDASIVGLSDINSRLMTPTTPTHSQPPTQATTPMAGSPRTHFSKSLSMTSVTSFTGPSGIAPSNELLSHLDTKICVNALEIVLTLLASQSLLALKNEKLSSREKQLIRRELSTELLQFHDFVRKKITREFCKRKKHGLVLMESHYDRGQLDESQGELDATLDKTPIPIVKSSDHAKSLRVNLAKKLHQKQLFDTTVPISPISKPKGPQTTVKEHHAKESTPLKSILKPSTSTSQKRHVMFEPEEESEPKVESELEKKKRLSEDDDEETFYLEPETEPPYTGLSFVKMVEEDYFHLLSNIFTHISQHE
uniref:CSON001696 protein n=1 Tax=Culicoides sonorensis TaxID=179676 RepID=A0A336LW21_CULSO